LQAGTELTALLPGAGAMARGVAQREARLQQFALSVRSAATKLQQGRPGGRRYRTQDVVRDTPLPEFKLDLSLLAAAFRPNRWAGGQARPRRQPQRAAGSGQRAAGSGQRMRRRGRRSGLPQLLLHGFGERACGGFGLLFTQKTAPSNQP
jgi:hypothetical protein